jgi:DNA-binding transcriptional MerR regulator
VLIGELARRLRVSTRTLRHYAAIGLLEPGDVDPSTGYRGYGAAELVRGVRIEQLKAVGLTLTEIGHMLDAGAPVEDVLRERRRELLVDIGRRTAQVAAIDALLASSPALCVPALVTIPTHPVADSSVVATDGDLSACVRRRIQRLRRQLMVAEPGRSWTFAARFALDLDDRPEVDVAALGPATPTTTWAGGPAVQLESIGPHSLLPLAFDAALTAAAAAGHVPTGVVQETYLQLGPVARTLVAVFVQPTGATLGRA